MTANRTSIAGVKGTLHDRSLRVGLIAAVAILFIALAVRLFGLTYHSLWFDEVMSTYWAAKPAGDIWRVGMTLVQDKHPPLYYLLLHFWMALFGRSDGAVRSLGLVIGGLAVLPAFGIGTQLGDLRAAALGALFVAVSPFLVWYSQEARMFMPATTFALVGLYGIVRIFDSRSTILSVMLVVGGFTAALYSYLFSAFLLPVAAAWLLLLWWLTVRSPSGLAGQNGLQACRAGQALGVGFASLALVALLFLPLARVAWSMSAQESPPGRAFEGMVPALWRLLEAYTVGWPHWPAEVAGWIVVGAAVLALLGLVVQSPAGSAGPVSAPWPACRWQDGRARPRAGGAFLALWLVLPVVAGGWLVARDRTVFAETRYFIFLVPALCLAWGRALAWLWDQWRPAGVGGLVLAFGVVLAALPADWSAQNRREAWREAAALIESQAGPNDAVLVEPDYVSPALTRYLPASRPIYYPFTDRLDDPAVVDAPLEGLREYDAVWLVQSHHQELDPGELVVSWFNARYPLITEAYPAGIVLRAFAQRYRTSELPAGVSPIRVDLGSLQLLGCTVKPRSLKARDDLYHPPSGWAHATTYWTATAPMEEDVYPYVRLVDSPGQIWGESLDRPVDAIHLWPTSRWQPGEIVRLDYDVNLNPITPAGAYQVTVHVPGGTGQALCGDVEVRR